MSRPSPHDPPPSPRDRGAPYDWDTDDDSPSAHETRTYGARGRGATPRSGATLADADNLTPRLRRRRAYALLGMTLVAPGSAQLVAGNRRLGRVALRVWFAGLAIALTGLVLALVKRNWLLGFASRSWVLMGLAVLAGLLALVWAVSFVDAARLARLGRLPGGTRRNVALLTALGVALTAGPLGWAASSLYTGGSVLGSVFSAGVSRPPAQGRYNILLLGGDSGADRIGTRPDTIMLASIDADTGRTVTFGFARDTENINFRPGSTMARLMPQGWNCGDECLLNGLYMWATEHKDQFGPDVPDPGALATKEAVEALSGLDIQYYMLIDLQGFQKMVDAVGGLDVITKTRVPVGGGSSPVYEYIEPGRHHFDGFYALWYARSREGSTNYERMARQKCVLAAASKQLDPQTVILRFRDLAAAGEQVLHTDIPQSDLGGLADLAVRGRAHPMKSVNFVPPLINPWDYDPSVIRDTVAQAVKADPPPAPTRPSAPAGSAPSSAAAGNPGAPAPQPGAGGGTADTSKGEKPNASAAGDGSDVCAVP